MSCPIQWWDPSVWVLGCKSKQSQHFSVHVGLYPNLKLMEKVSMILSRKQPRTGHLYKPCKAGAHGSAQAGYLLHRALFPLSIYLPSKRSRRNLFADKFR